jgi:hypothetical protein
MPPRHLRPSAAALLAALAVPLALAACSSGATGTTSATGANSGPAPSAPPPAAPAPASPDANLLTGTQLKGLLEPDSSFPPGFTSDPSGSRDTGSSYELPSTTQVRKPKCRMLGGTAWISITGINGVSFAQDAYIDKASSAEIAQEIDVYRGTTSQAVLRKVAAISAACPWYTDAQTGSRATIREQARPKLGDGGYVITVTDPAWRSGTTLVAARVGTAVVTVLSTTGADNGRASAMKLAAALVAELRGMA